MKHELKVILGATARETLVFIDDQPVGLIQEIKFVANAETGKTDIELTFPDFREYATTNGAFAKQLDSTLELLKEMPHIRVLLKPIW